MANSSTSRYEALWSLCKTFKQNIMAYPLRMPMVLSDWAHSCSKRHNLYVDAILPTLLHYACVAFEKLYSQMSTLREERTTKKQSCG